MTFSLNVWFQVSVCSFNVTKNALLLRVKSASRSTHEALKAFHGNREKKERRIWIESLISPYHLECTTTSISTVILEPIIKHSARNEAKSEAIKAPPPRLIYMLTQRIVNYHSASIDKHRRWRRIYDIASIIFNYVTPVYSADRKSHRGMRAPALSLSLSMTPMTMFPKNQRLFPGNLVGIREYSMQSRFRREIHGHQIA